jgi:hypothetical protein
MVQNGELVSDRHARCQQFAKSPDNPFFVEVTLGIVISSNSQNPGMVASRSTQQVVQFFKIVGVVSEQYAAFEYRMRQVHSVISARNTDLNGKADIVAGPVQQPYQQPGRTIVVQVQLHRLLSRAISSAVSSRGCGLYL